jgi:hypothetical protein
MRKKKFFIEKYAAFQFAALHTFAYEYSSMVEGPVGVELSFWLQRL